MFLTWWVLICYLLRHVGKVRAHSDIIIAIVDVFVITRLDWYRLQHHLPAVNLFELVVQRGLALTFWTIIIAIVLFIFFFVVFVTFLETVEIWKFVKWGFLTFTLLFISSVLSWGRDSAGSKRGGLSWTNFTFHLYKVLIKQLFVWLVQWYSLRLRDIGLELIFVCYFSCQLLFTTAFLRAVKVWIRAVSEVWRLVLSLKVELFKLTFLIFVVLLTGY